MDYTASYLLANIPLIGVWAYLYWRRSDVRREMLAMSGIFGFAALIVEPMYIADWWQPLTLLGTRIGFEDVLFGALIGGISATAYEVLYEHRLRRMRFARKQLEPYILYASLASCGALFFATLAFGHSSFAASIAALGIPTLFIWFKRPDLIRNSLASGVLMATFLQLSFFFAEYLTPEWVSAHWTHDNLSGVLIVIAPVEDIVWAFLCGTFIGPLYEFWKELKVIESRKRQ